MEAGTQLAAVVEALDAAMSITSSSDIRKNATAFLEQVKSAEPRTAAQLGIALASSEKAEHIRLFGVQLLQGAALGHWPEFSAEEQQQLSKLSFDLLLSSTRQDVARSLRSKSAALLADIVRQSGPQLWEELLPALVNMASSGPTQAEAAALVLHFLPEDITVHNENLDGDKRRQWLVSLTATLPQVLPFLCSLLETNFTAALGAVQRGDLALGRSHAGAVGAALGSAGAYADWAPVTALGSSKLVEACGYLLSASEFRLPACDFLKLLAARRRQQEDAEAFDAAIGSLFGFSIAAAKESLQRLSASSAQGMNGDSEEGALDYNPAEAEFAQGLCEVFVALTPTNLHRLVQRDDNVLPRLMDVLLQYFRHSIFSLHSQSLPLWTILLRESAAAAGAIVGYQHGFRVSRGDKDPRSSWCIVPPEHCVSLLEGVVGRLQQWAQGQGPGEADDELLGGSTSSDYTQYRSRLLEVIRLVAAQQPLAAACKASSMLDAAIALVGSNPDPDPKVIASAEAAQTFFECTLAGIPDASMAAAASFSTNPGVLCDELSLVLEGMLKQLIALTWPPQNGALIEIHGHLLDSLGPYAKHNPTAAGQVVGKLFSLLRQLPPVALGAEPLGRPEKAEERLPRLQVCTSVLRLCRAAAPALTNHLKSMVDSVTQVAEEAKAQRNNRTLVVTGETILLGEALICVAAAAGSQEEGMVLEWLFAPVRQRWVDPQWQQRAIKDASTFSRLLAHAPGTPEEDDFWFLYHALMLFERCMRRAPVLAPISSSQPAHQQHAASPHLHWIVPSMLETLRWMHALWRPEVRGFLPPTLNEALNAGSYEQAVLLGLVGPASGGGTSTGAGGGSTGGGGGGRRGGGGGLLSSGDSGGGSTATPDRTAMITRRNWLKGLRDNGYGFLGLAAVNANSALFNLPPSVPQQLDICCLESLASIEVRHLKLLLKLVIGPIARGCPRDTWQAWIGPLLPPLLRHCGARLSQSWATKAQAQGGASKSGGPSTEGTAGGAQGPSGGSGVPGGTPQGSAAAAVRQEMFDDKMLRDFSREHGSLLASLPRLPPLAPSASTPGTPDQDQPPLALVQTSGGRVLPSPMPPSNATGGGSGAGAGGGGPYGPLGTSPMGPMETPGRPDSLFWFLLAVNPEATLAALASGIESMGWPDSEAAHKGIAFCSSICAMPELLCTLQNPYPPTTPSPSSSSAPSASGPTSAPSTSGLTQEPPSGSTQFRLPPEQQVQLCSFLRETVGRNMFSGAMSALTLESNASAQAELLGLLRDIYFKLGLSGLSSAPKEVLLSLPGMTPSALEQFDSGLKRSGSPKEQRAVFRTLLLGLGGDQLKALACQRSTTTITNVSGYVKKLNHDAQVSAQQQQSSQGTESADGTSIGLASILPPTK